MKGFLFVGPDGVDKDAALEAWVARTVEHARVLPEKKPAPKKKPREP